jgi:CheY-like chemotaxis protein
MAGHPKILLIDDDKDDQLFFVDALGEIAAHLGCTIANNGMEGLEYLHSPAPLPAIIFLDLNMPYMNGFECLSAIKSDSSYTDIPVIIFTTSNNARDCEKSLQMGAATFMTKPCDFGELKENIQHILQSHFSLDLKI